MFSDISAFSISEFHDSCLAVSGWSKLQTAQFNQGIWQFIEINHRHNCLLWDEEDLARRKDVADNDIAQNKRAIDGYNQRRNDAIEHIDETLLQRLSGVTLHGNARLNSETAGAMMDRLSILSLKIFHMRLQTERKEVEPAHIDACQQKLARLIEQRIDLQACLDRLLQEAATGDTYFKIYRQFKMYNDPSLNPCLYK